MTQSSISHRLPLAILCLLPSSIGAMCASSILPTFAPCDGNFFPDVPEVAFARDFIDPCICRALGDTSLLPHYDTAIAEVEARVDAHCVDALPRPSLATGLCDDGSILWIGEGSGFAFTTSFYEAETGRLIGVTFASDDGIAGCNSVFRLIDRIECETAETTRDFCE